MCVGGAEVTARLYSVPPHLLLPSTVVEIGINKKTTQSDTNTKPNKKKSLNKSLETQEENDLSLY